MTDPVFYAPKRCITVGEIAALTGAEVVDPATIGAEILGIAAADASNDRALTFIRGRAVIDTSPRGCARRRCCARPNWRTPSRPASRCLPPKRRMRRSPGWRG